MVRKTFKWLAYLLAAIVLLCGLVLALIRWYPQSILTLVNNTTDYQVSASEMKAGLWPLKLRFEDLNVGQAQLTIIQMQDAEFKVDWFGQLQGRYNFWFASLANGTVDLRSIAQAPESQTAENKQAIHLNLHRLISALNGQVKEVKFIVNDDVYFHIHEIRTQLNDDHLLQSNNVKQQIFLQFAYGPEKVDIQGMLQSVYEKGRTKLVLKLSDLDISGVLQAQKNKQKTVDENAVEAAIDWSWLKQINTTDVQFELTKLIAGENQLEDFMFKVGFGNSITIQELSADLKWKLSDKLTLNDRVNLSGELQPLTKITTQADVKTELMLQTPKANLKLAGELNINGVVGNHLLTELQLNSLPLQFVSESDDDAIKQIQQFLPVSLNVDYQQTDQELVLQNIKAKLGASDVGGRVVIKQLDNSIDAQLTSENLIYKALVKKESKDKKTNKAKLFSDQLIDWQWLDNLKVNAHLQAKLLDFDGLKFHSFDAPLIMNNGQLLIKDLSSGLGKGKIQSTLQLLKQESGAHVSVNLQLDKVDFDAFGVFPNGEVKGGVTNGNVELITTGNSSQTLANNLNGNAFLEVNEAVIGNDSFELVGSDLILELLNKLNPFTKSDPTTQLKCAVINSQITDGEIKFDNSLVVETSKIIITADGEVSLPKEEINLLIQPKARKSVGVNVGNLVHFMKLGGPLTNPKPEVSASGLLKTGVAVGAAVSTGGMSMLAESLLDSLVLGGACENARNAFSAKKPQAKTSTKGQEPSADKEPSASLNKEPSADKEPSASLNKEPSANKKPPTNE